MNKLILFSAVIVLFGCQSQKNNQESVDSPLQGSPNVIVILLDDAGYADFGFMGCQDLETPNIDALANDGMIFSDAHVSATVCAPSRAGLITGKYQQRFGFEANGTGDETTGDLGLAKETNTIAELLKAKSDYKTIAIGKWHLGGTSNNHPNNRGFDDFFGFLGGGRSYFYQPKESDLLAIQHNGEKQKFEGYLTDVFGDASVNFVEANKDHPFMMYLSYNAVHTPMEAKAEDLEKYKNHPRKHLAAMTWSLDQNIGKLVSKLKSLNLYDNTLIFFLSDNGGAHNNQSTHGKLKGWKGNKFEAGHRVPFFVTWPKKIKSASKFDGLTSSLDVVPTILDACQLYDKTASDFDGVSLMPYLTQQISGHPHETLFWRKLDESAVRHLEHKLISLNGYGQVMYNLKDDIGEQHNLMLTNPEIAETLNQKYEAWQKNLMPPLWKEGEAWETVTYDIHKLLMQNKTVLHKEPKASNTNK